MVAASTSRRASLTITRTSASMPRRASTHCRTATRRRIPVTANVWAEHSVWPQDPQFPRALASGVTTAQILPGSANLIGGRSVVLKMVPSRDRPGNEVPGREVRARRWRAARTRSASTRNAARRRAWATSRAIAPRGSRRKRIVADGTSGTPTIRAIRRRATSDSRRSPKCCAATFSCTITAIAPTRWRR